MGTSEGKPRSAASVLAGAVNVFALLGWAVLLCAAFAYFMAPLPAHFYALAVVCELICASEVVQIMIGVLRGRLALGVILHYTRLLVLLAVLSLPAVAPSLAASLVYVAWAATEVFRYPMFLSNATMVRKLRYAVPVVTFPVGAVAEAWACYLALGHISNPLLYAAVWLVIPTNTLGGLAAFPGMLKKAVGEGTGKYQKLEEAKALEEANAQGVLFPKTKGKRSSMATGAAVWAAAAGAVDGDLAAAISRDAKAWRSKYSKHAVRCAEASAASTAAALAVADAGLQACYDQFEFVRDGAAVPLRKAMAAPDAGRKLSHAVVVGGGGAPLKALEVPFEGKTLRGAALAAQVKHWAAYGAMEPACADALCAVVARGDKWLDLRGKSFVVLGATSALGPLATLLACGATVLAVARPRTATWAKLIATARASAGKLVLPLHTPCADGAADVELAGAAGADLLVDTPEIAAWAEAAVAALKLPPPTVGIFVYLDGDLHARVSLACDAIVEKLTKAIGGVSLAYLQTPSIAYTIPAEAHADSEARYNASALAKLCFLPPNARPPSGAEGRHVHDGLVSMQGPNYALAKTMQLWRAALAYGRDGLLVSVNVAPPSRTASMTQGNKNAGTIAAFLDGAGHFAPNVVLDAETVAAVMAGLLVHDLMNPAFASRPKDHPWAPATRQAFHGGSFRMGVKPAAMGAFQLAAGKLLGKAKQPVPAQS